MKFAPQILARSIATLAVTSACVMLANHASAATLYWDGSGTAWGTNTFWSTVVGATTPDPAAVPGNADIAQFSISTITAAQTVSLGATQSALGLIFSSTGTTALQGGGTNQTLNLGTSGIAVNTGAGAVTIGSGTAGQNVALSLQGSQTWTNAATTVLTVNNGASLGVVGANTLSLSNTSTAANVIGGVLANGSGTLALSVNNGTGGTGSWTLSGANTFSGGTTIVSGILQLNNNSAAGTGTITMNSGGTVAQRIVLNAGVVIANNIVVGTSGNVTGATGIGLIERTGTGTGTINGTITINSNASAGGHFRGAGAGSELILNGAITVNNGIRMTQRDGTVRYSGGGTGYVAMDITGTAQVGATNGIATTATPVLGVSNAGTLNLNGFDQAVAGLFFGNAGAAHTGTLTLGSRTLTLNGNLATQTGGTFSAAHVINATAGGAVNVGGTTRTFTVTDSLATDDLTVNDVAITGTGGFSKEGAGTLALRNVAVAGPLAVNGGALQTGRFNAVGNLTTASLAFGAGTTLKMKVGTGGDVINTGPLTTAGTTSVVLSQFGGALPVGTYNLINYTGASPGLGGFSLAQLPGHAVATLADTGNAIALAVTGNDRVLWTGLVDTAWNEATQNWKLESNSSPTTFIQSDEVIFADGPTTSTIDIAANVSPSKVNFENTAVTTYTVTGAGGMIGAGSLQVTGGGKVILRSQNGYTGATTVNAGTLELDHDATGNLVLTGTSGVTVAANATLQLTRDDGGIAFDRVLAGTGTVEINPHSIVGGATAHSVTLSGNNAGFTGTLRLLAPASGTYRINGATAAGLGGSTIQVASGAQIFTAQNQTYTNNITIAGTGFADSAGNIGALRIDNGSIWAGNIVVDAGGARIGAHNATATVSGSISGGDLTVNATNFNNNYTLLFTGANSYGQTIIGGQNTQTAGVPSMRLNIGNGGTTGTLGAGNVIINGDGANGVLGFDRSDGYTLATGQTITGGGSNLARTFIDIDTRGTGFSDNGNTITLGTTAAGGNVRVGQSRAGSIANFSGTLTAGQLFAGSAALSTTNINTGANINVATLHVARTGASGSVLNINGGTLNVTGQFNLGEQAANNSGSVVQSDGNVTVAGQIRVGHFLTNTSNYTLGGGTLKLSGTPGGFPYFSTVNETNGGIYLGIDGTGNLTQNGGSITTNFLVLDNRGETGPGANTPSGTDTYTLNGGSLILTNAFGVISRNPTAAVNLNGGTIQAATGISPNLDSDKISVGGPATIDTNGANTFTLYGPLGGTGSLAIGGGGTFRAIDGVSGVNTQIGGTMPGGSLGAVSVQVGAATTLQSDRVGVDAWSGAISGAGALVKQNTGSLFLTGDHSGFTGTVNVSGGRLDLPANSAASAVTVADGAALGAESSHASVTVGSATGGTLLINASTIGALHAANLTLNGTTTVDFAVAPTGAGPYRVLTYGSTVSLLTFQLANSAAYRPGFAFDASVAGVVTLKVENKTLAWTGTAGATWDVNTTQSWSDGVAADGFFAGDRVTFGDGAVPTAVAVASGVSPWKTTINSATNNYTLTSTGNGIAGPGSLEKLGSSTLTLVGPNTYGGSTVIREGILTVATANSLGNGGTTNALVLDGGSFVPSAAMDLGARPLTVDAGGGTISATGTTAYTVSIPGRISGTGTLTLTSGSTAAPTFVLSGNNTGYSGNVNVNSAGATAGGTNLRLASNNALTAGTVTLTEGVVNGAATGLDLANATIGAGVTLVMNSNLSGANSLRSQLTASSGTNVWNGPIQVNGTNVVQISNAVPLTLNGPISTGTGGFTGTFLLRGGGLGGVVNGTITLPNGVVNKTDGGTWQLNSTGSWLTTNVQVGTLRLGINDALPTSAPLNMGQGDTSAATLDLNGFNQATPVLSQNVGASGVRQITNTAPTLSTLTLNAANPSTYGNAGIAILAGNLSLTKNGNNVLTLGGTNTFTGGVLLNAGTIKLNSNTSPLGATSSTLVVADGTTIDANGQSIPAASRIASVTVQGTGVGGLGAIQNTGGNVVNSNFWNAITLAGDTTIGTNSRYDLSNGTFNGGTFTLTKIGTGETWWNPAAGATIGNIVVNAGTLGVQGSSNLGSNAHAIIVNAAGQIQTFSAITNSKPVILNGGQLAANNNTSTWTGSITLNGAGTTNRLGTITAGVGVVLNGPVTGPGGFEKIGTGTLTLGSATNDYLGETKVSGGTVLVATGANLPSTTALDMNGGSVNLNGTTQTVSGLKGAAGTLTSTAAASLTVDQLTNTTYGGGVSGALSLVKDGPGTLTLTGANTSTGTTRLAEGELVVNGSITGALILDGGLLKGTGMLGLLTVNAGSVLAPGASPGILNAGSTAFSGGEFAVEIHGAALGTGYDQLNVAGAVSLTTNTPLTISLGFFDPQDSVDLFTIVNNDGADPIDTSGGLFTFGGNPLSQGEIFTVGTQDFQISYSGVDGNDVVLAAVPEPATGVILLGSLLCLGMRRQRRAGSGS